MARTKLNADVLVIGGGAAGITAARTLHEAGLDVVVVEARERVGGRIFTRRDSGATPVPIELGAQFIHGSAPELARVLHEASLSSVDVGGEPGPPWTDGCAVWTISGSGSIASCGAWRERRGTKASSGD